jgi:hypothetical protein
MRRGIGEDHLVADEGGRLVAVGQVAGGFRLVVFTKEDDATEKFEGDVYDGFGVPAADDDFAGELSAEFLAFKVEILFCAHSST